MQHFAVNDHDHCVLWQGQCGNCAESAARAEKLATMVKEREVTIKELKSLCVRFETQLTQQDVLLKQWADSKGHKITLPKWPWPKFQRKKILKICLSGEMALAWD